MNKRLSLVVIVLIVGILFQAPISVSTHRNSTGLSRLQAKPSTANAAVISNLPIYFVKNAGQLDPEVQYSIAGTDTSAYFTKTGITFSVLAPATPFAPSDFLPSPENPNPPAPSAPPQQQRWVVREIFEGANPDPVIEALNPYDTTFNFFTGPQSQWATSVPTFASIIYRDLYPSIDLLYNSQNSNLKYAFVVHPGGNPADIKLRYEGATSVEINAGGDLVINNGINPIIDQAPFTFQDTSGGQVVVSSSYTVTNNLDTTYTVSFNTGSYDAQLDLTIDPLSFAYSGYVGGAGSDTINDIEVQPDGQAVIVGSTSSNPFPTTVGPDLTYNGGTDAFVARVKADGSGYDFAGYIGGNTYDAGTGVGIDPSGAIYVGGLSYSAGTGFPTTTLPNPVHNGDYDAFVVKISPDASTILYSGFLGGSNTDWITGVDVGLDGSMYVVGDTFSSNFPVIVGPEATLGGSYDVFVAKVKADGSGFDYSGYVRGNVRDYATQGGIVVNAAGNAFITGTSDTADGSFLTPGVGAYFQSNHGWYDVFFSKIKVDGSGYEFKGLLGGITFDATENITIDAQENIYLVGRTPSANFPIVGSLDSTMVGQEGFIVKIAADASSIVYSSFIGGDGTDLATAVAVDSLGDAYVAGSTDSTQTSFPVSNFPIMTYSGGTDDFILKIDPTGSSYLLGGYLGGTSYDVIYEMKLDSEENIYLVGYTGSTDFAPIAVGPFTTEPGAGDGTITKIGISADLSLTKTTPSSSVSVGADVPYTMTVTNTDTEFAASGVVLTDPLPAGLTFISATPSQGTCSFVDPIVTCTLGGLGVGATATVDLLTKSTIGGGITNVATVSSTISDPVTANNSASAAMTVIDRTVQFEKTSSGDSESTLTSGIAVVLSQAAATDVTVDYTITGGTATNGADYTLANGTLTFPAGTTSQSIQIQVIDDGLVEPTEIVTMALSNPVNAILGANQAHTFSIVDNDAVERTLQFLDASSSEQEGDRNISRDVILSRPSSETVLVDVVLGSGTATSGSDFVFSSPFTLSFPPGSTKQSFSLGLKSDNIAESDEAIILSLDRPQGALLGDPTTHTITITETPIVVKPPVVVKPPILVPPSPPITPPIDILKIILTILTTVTTLLALTYATGLFVGAGTAIASGFGFGAYTLGAVGIYLFYLFTEPLRALLGGKKKNYGVVYNALSKQPVDLAIVRLFNEEGKLLKTRITDKKGRFLFTLDKDEKIHLTVTKAGFTFPDSLLHNEDHDSAYDHLYYGAVMSTKAEDAIIPNIPLDPPEIDGSEEAFNRRRFKQKLGTAISLIGSIVALVTAIMYPSWLTIGLVVVHVLLYLLFARLSHGKRPSPWGITSDKETGAPLPATIARIFDKQYNRLLDMTQSDTRGRYAFLADKSLFYATFEHPDYAPATTQTIDLTKKPEGGVIDLDIGLQRSGG